MEESKRRPNFSAREIEILVTTATAYPHLDANHRDVQTNQRKKAAYEAIAAAVSAVGVARRTADQWRKTIQMLTSEAKGAAAERERNMRRTGGGPPPAPLTAAQNNALDLVPVVNNTGVSGGFALLHL